MSDNKDIVSDDIEDKSKGDSKLSRNSKKVIKKDNKLKSKTDSQTTIIDHVQDRPEHSNNCVVYKFRSRPPYEGFILILVIVLLTALLIWWLNSKFNAI